MVFAHVTAHALVLATFCVIYGSMLSGDTHFFKENPHCGALVDSVTYAVSVHTLLGDPTIRPKTTAAKMVTSVHALLAFLLTGSIIIHEVRSRISDRP